MEGNSEGISPDTGQSSTADRWDSVWLSQKTPLPALDLESQLSSTSEAILKSYHFSMIFTLADGFQEEAIDNADPALANNLRNLRDHDIGVFAEATEFIGRGATFNVRRTLFGDSRDVVFKSRRADPDRDEGRRDPREVQLRLPPPARVAGPPPEAAAGSRDAPRP